ncbi:MAG TPA: alpha/beta fold hydrolase [Candidatus Limnocylindrales bacterium]|nr:alpha/beta fold hydrolase [Candidatus Limnocylindrales bacterium]
MPRLRRAGVAAAIAAAPLALAYRFAVAYRVRAGYPIPRPPQFTPADIGLPFESVDVPSGHLTLPGWFVAANDGAPGPGVALVHGWESARDRLLPMVAFLHAAGFHCLAVDVRGHGTNAIESLPITAGEFGADALAAFRALDDRPEVTRGAISGHSMGAIGAILAAAADPRIAAVVATSAPADPWRLTRQTFRLARLPIPDPIAYPLAWLTTRVYLRPRGHSVAEISATAALRAIDRPVLLAHGDLDAVVPFGHLGRLARAATAAGHPPQTLAVHGGHHSWLYEFPEYRRAVAAFLAGALGGPLSPEEAADRAAAVDAHRLPDSVRPPTVVESEPGGFRSLARMARPLPRPPAGPAGPDAPDVLEPGLPHRDNRSSNGPNPGKPARAGGALSEIGS